ncbi:MAG: geranylgeranylglycerol-phosphate geranylgeranyltransferase [Flavobacteriales bacterium]
MNPIWAFIKTTRPVNILIIVSTMYAMRYFVGIDYALMDSALDIHIYGGISDFKFLLLTIIMVFLAASGNIINDYFDVKVDRINKPERITIDRGLKRRVAMAAHHTLNGLAVVLGFYVGWAEQVWFYSFLPVIIAGALWFYSFYLKKTFLLGNVLVALVVSIVPIWATYGTLTSPLINSANLEANSFPISQLYIFYATIIMGYTIQAYVISLFREIVKDAEDVEGDRLFGYRTMPIVWGWAKTRNLLLITQFAWLVVLGLICYFITVTYIPLLGLTFGLLVVIPFLLSLMSMSKKNIQKKHFSSASLWLKLTLGGGLIYSYFIPELMGSFLYQHINLMQ